MRAGAAFPFLLAGIAILAVSSCVSNDTGRREGYPAARYTKSEFEAMVRGKTPEEVLGLLGEPFSRESGTRGEVWFYRDIAFDPFDYGVSSAGVVFNGGGSPRAVRVEFRSPEPEKSP